MNGPAMGGGFDLATLCDIRICSKSAIFGHPEVKFGAPTLFTPLRWIIGEGLARDLCLTGVEIDAKEAYRIGLVSEIVDAQVLLDRTVKIGEMIVEVSLETIQTIKKYFIDNAGQNFEDSFFNEHDKAFRQILTRIASEKFKK